TDIYALGMIMWELLAGEPPFNNVCHDISLILNICDGLPPNSLAEIMKNAGTMTLINTQFLKKVQNDNSLLTSIELVCPKCYLDCKTCNRPCQDETWCDRKPKTGLKNLIGSLEKYKLPESNPITDIIQKTYKIDKEKDL
ncbi:8281_t:CDS:2, partial [Dentiscutata erythropus]